MTRAPLTVRREASPTFDAPLIVHSHLRWDFVWQRPQQLLSRFARSGPVFFLEEPLVVDDLETGRLELTEPAAGVTRAVPLLPARFRGDYDASIAEIRALVLRTLRRRRSLARTFARPVHWFYTPMPAPAMLGAFGERGVVYDCMDELSQFRGAPPDLVQRERLLLASADIVFTGGYQLYLAKSRRHDRVHFFGCGVDVDHFAAARLAHTIVPPDLAALRRPVLGYFGVVDERLDYDLLRELAAARPDASVVLVGPVVKVDPASLPRGANLHWLGQRPYAQLPAIVKGFDVCLMPFALNEATEYINPTKTLEYMAAGKPVVSTAVADVVRNFAPVVDVAGSRDDFLRLVDAAISARDDRRIAAGIDRATEASWESVVIEMRHLIAGALATRRDDRAASIGGWREATTGASAATPTAVAME